MFDTMKIAAVIRQGRVDRNMTQMQLADAMGVSYQAVSNWERGNSMPDISKLEDLCRALNITVEQLLGMETPAAAVTKVMAEEELTVEELAEVAPVLPPKTLKKQLKGEKKQRKLKLEAIADLAPFLGQAELEELLADAELPEDLEGLEDIAPFLSRKTLDSLVERMEIGSLEHLEDIAPFLSRETLGKVVARCSGEGELEIIADLAPFLGREILDKMVDDLIEAEFDPEEQDLSDLYPFISREAAGRLARYLLSCRELEALEDLIPYYQ